MVDFMNQQITAPVEHRFNPYSFHGGTVLGVAGDDFAVIASDTRLSEGFYIHSRNLPKTYQLTENSVLGCCGFHGDVLALIKNIKSRIKMYQHEHSKEMSTKAIAQMLSTMLYYKRFFPYYAYNILAGIDSDGKGAIYSYDPVGSYERETFRAAGSSSTMLQSFLDNQIGEKNMKNKSTEGLSKEKCVALVKDIYIGAAERDIETGDAVEICIVTRDGIEKEVFPLRRD